LHLWLSIMSTESEIKKLCESYIGRAFDDEDLRELRKFLSGLQKQKVAQSPDKKPEKLDSLVKLKSVPVIPHSSGDAIPSYVKEHKEEEDLESVRAERVAEIQSAPKLKDRLGTWQEKIASNEEDVGKTDESVKAERLAEVKVASGVKDRLGNWNEIISKNEDGAAQTSEKKVEIKTSQGLKERLGAYEQASSSGNNESKTAERVAELKEGSGVKSRLGAYQQAVEKSDKVERTAGVVSNTSVKDRLGNWNKIQEEQPAVVTSNAFVAERTAEAKQSTSLKDRMNAFNNEANKPEVAVRKEPIKIDYGF